MPENDPAFDQDLEYPDYIEVICSRDNCNSMKRVPSNCGPESLQWVCLNHEGGTFEPTIDGPVDRVGPMGDIIPHTCSSCGATVSGVWSWLNNPVEVFCWKCWRVAYERADYEQGKGKGFLTALRQHLNEPKADIIPSSDYIPSSDHERWASNYVRWLGAAPSFHELGGRTLPADAGAEIVLEGDDSKCIVGVQATNEDFIKISKLREALRVIIEVAAWQTGPIDYILKTIRVRATEALEEE